MCTVSFVRVNDAVIITSNRDEHIHRENAAAPGFHQLQNKKVIFPKDARACGTWFVAGEDGTVAVLLNGAFKKHIAQPPYRKSRGLILLDLTAADEPHRFFKIIDLDNIEPFTIILHQPGLLHELRWDGNNKHEQELDLNGKYIWSSSTLYTDEVTEHRKNLFDRFVRSNEDITAEAIQKFHATSNGDEENGFVISRQTGMKTFSITQAVVQSDHVNFSHADLLQQKKYSETLPVHKATKNISEKF
jgi:uncharacterized protein with NRDE domain